MPPRVPNPVDIGPLWPTPRHRTIPADATSGPATGRPAGSALGLPRPAPRRRADPRSRPGAGRRKAPVPLQGAAALRTLERARRLEGAPRPRPAPGRAAPGALPLRRRRHRQVHADGPVLRRGAGRRQAPGPFPCLHAGGAGTPAYLAPGDQGQQGRPPAGAGRRPDRRGLADLLRRVPRGQRGRRHDPGPAVRGRCSSTAPWW